MQIAYSDIILTSASSQNRLDAKSEELSIDSNSVRLQTVPPTQFNNPDGVQIRAGRDRVTISIEARETFASSQSSSMKSRAVVKSAEGNETALHEQAHVAETIVGDLIDKRVFITEISEIRDAQTRSNSPGAEISNTISLQAEKLEVSYKSSDVHYEEDTMRVESSGIIRTEDGREINFSLQLEMNSTYFSKSEQEVLLSIEHGQVDLTDPLVINFGGKAPELTSTKFEFDLDAHGQKEQISFLKHGSGFLAFDSNKDGIVNDGRELFGPASGNGFSELAAYDDDGNDWIDENDAIFSQLSVWTKDESGNDVLMSLKDADVGAIYLANTHSQFDMKDRANNLNGRITRTSVYVGESGNVKTIQQIDLAARPIENNEEKEPDQVLQKSTGEVHSEINEMREFMVKIADMREMARSLEIQAERNREANEEFAKSLSRPERNQNPMIERMEEFMEESKEANEKLNKPEAFRTLFPST